MSIFTASSLSAFDRELRSIKRKLQLLRDDSVIISDAAAVLGLTHGTIKRWIEKDYVEHTRVDLKRKVNVESLKAYFFDKVESRRKNLQHAHISSEAAARTTDESLEKLTYESARDDLFIKEAMALTGLSRSTIMTGLKDKIFTLDGSRNKMIKKVDVLTFHKLIADMDIDVTDMSIEDCPEYLTTEQVAVIIGLSRPSIHNYIANKRLKTHSKTLGVNLIKKSDLITFMESKTDRRRSPNKSVHIQEDSKQIKQAKRFFGNKVINKKVNQLLSANKTKKQITAADLGDVTKGFTKEEIAISLKELNEALKENNSPDLISFGISYQVVRDRNWSAGESIR